ncbi:MAG: hypothetical protein AAF430_07230 [Myxococcota bacterium]
MKRFAALLLSSLLLASVAQAGPINGSGLIEGKDAATGRLMIEGTVYLVDPEAQLLWENGDAFTMSSLMAQNIDAPGGLWPLLRAEYEGSDGATRSDPDVLDRIVIRYASE